jgi:acetyl esterase/lipase
MVSHPLSRRDVLALSGFASLASATMGSASQPPDRRAELYGLLGELPDRRRPIRATKRSEDTRDSYVLETWELDLNGIEPVPAYVARPATVSGRLPAVLFNHSHGGGYKIGKQEFIDGRSYLQPEPYARVFTRLGCIGVSIDHWVFGERSHTSEADMFKAMLWQGQVLWGMMVYDSLRALDWLIARPDVDAARIGTLGISMGSTMAWWLAALDQRVKVTVDICCLTDFHTLLAEKGLAGHGIYYYVPALLRHFTTAQINALIAPRAHLGLAVIDRELTRVYADQGHPERWKLLRYDVGHMETAEGRREIIAFLQRFL